MLALVIGDQFMQMLGECRQHCQVRKEMQCVSDKLLQEDTSDPHCGNTGISAIGCY